MYILHGGARNNKSELVVTVSWLGREQAHEFASKFQKITGLNRLRSYPKKSNAFLGKIRPKNRKERNLTNLAAACGNHQNQRRQHQFTSTQEKEERKLNMSVLLVNVPSRAQPLWKSKSPGKLSPSNTRLVRLGNNHVVKAFFSNPIEGPIVRKALQEPVAFMGGMFAGLLRLDLNEDPLKDWVSRTVESSGITVEEIDAAGLNPEEDSPQQIEID